MHSLEFENVVKWANEIRISLNLDPCREFQDDKFSDISTEFEKITFSVDDFQQDTEFLLTHLKYLFDSDRSFKNLVIMRSLSHISINRTLENDVLIHFYYNEVISAESNDNQTRSEEKYDSDELDTKLNHENFVNNAEETAEEAAKICETCEDRDSMNDNQENNSESSNSHEIKDVEDSDNIYEIEDIDETSINENNFETYDCTYAPNESNSPASVTITVAADSNHDGIEELRQQLLLLQTNNEEMGRRCSELILKEKDMKSQSNPSVIRKLSTTPLVNTDSLTPELMHEKQVQLNDILNLAQHKKTKQSKQQQEFDRITMGLQAVLHEKEEELKLANEAYNKMQFEVLADSTSAKTGSRYSKKEIADLVLHQQQKYESLEKVRLKNISLRINLKKLEKHLQLKEQLAEGLHVMDFEQLKIENQALHDRIAARDEKIHKLKRKRVTSVLVLTHLREKLDHEENEQKKKLETISSLDDRVGRMRTLVSSTRFDSDKLIHEQDQAQTRQQFANNTLLLQDFESRKLYIEELKIKLNMLQEDFHRMQQKVRSAGKTSFATAYMPMNSAASSHSNRSRTFNRPRHASKNSSGSMLLLPMNSPLPGLLPIFKPKSMKSKPIK